MEVEDEDEDSDAADADSSGEEDEDARVAAASGDAGSSSVVSASSVASKSVRSPFEEVVGVEASYTSSPRRRVPGVTRTTQRSSCLVSAFASAAPTEATRASS